MKDEILKEMEVMKQAMIKISDMWDESGDIGLLDHGYPFQLDFDEMILKVNHWQNKTNENL